MPKQKIAGGAERQPAISKYCLVHTPKYSLAAQENKGPEILYNIVIAEVIHGASRGAMKPISCPFCSQHQENAYNEWVAEFVGEYLLENPESLGRISPPNLYVGRLHVEKTGSGAAYWCENGVCNHRRIKLHYSRLEREFYESLCRGGAK